MCEQMCFYLKVQAALSFEGREAEAVIVPNGRGEIYSTPTVTWYARKGAVEDCCQIIVLSSSLSFWRYAPMFVCFFEWIKREGEQMESHKSMLCIGQRTTTYGKSISGTVYPMCACVHVFSGPHSPRREKAQNEIKGKQLYWPSP